MLQSRPGITKASWAAVLECVWPHALQTCVSVMSPYSYAAWSMKLGITKRKAAHSSHTQWSVISLWKVFPSLSWSVRNRFCLLRSGPWIGAVCSGTLFGSVRCVKTAVPVCNLQMRSRYPPSKEGSYNYTVHTLVAHTHIENDCTKAFLWLCAMPLRFKKNKQTAGQMMPKHKHIITRMLRRKSCLGVLLNNRCYKPCSAGLGLGLSCSFCAGEGHRGCSS